MQKVTASVLQKLPWDSCRITFSRPPGFIVISLSTTTPRRTIGQYKTSPAAVHLTCIAAFDSFPTSYPNSSIHTTDFQTSTMTEPRNLAFPSIAAAWALNLVPHGYYFVKMMSASNYSATNVTPRTNLDTLKTRLPAATWNTLARARGAHLNAIEGFPLFAACMVCLRDYNLRNSTSNS